MTWIGRPLDAVTGIQWGRGASGKVKGLQVSVHSYIATKQRLGAPLELGLRRVGLRRIPQP